MLLVITLSPTAASLMLSAISASIEPTVNTKITDSQAKSVSLKFSTSVNTETSSQQPSARESSYRAVAISGMLSLVRASLPISLSTIPPSSSTQNDKKRSLSSFISKSRRIFQVFVANFILKRI